MSARDLFSPTSQPPAWRFPKQQASTPGLLLSSPASGSVLDFSAGPADQGMKYEMDLEIQFNEGGGAPSGSALVKGNLYTDGNLVVWSIYSTNNGTITIAAGRYLNSTVNMPSEYCPLVDTSCLVMCSNGTGDLHSCILRLQAAGNLLIQPVGNPSLFTPGEALQIQPFSLTWQRNVLNS